MIPRSFPNPLHHLGIVPLQRQDNTGALKAAIKAAQQRYPEQTARVRELGDFLTALALTHTQMEHFLNMGCIDIFMGQGTEAPLSCGPEGPGGDPDRWGAILKKLYQSCGPDAARALWSRFGPTLTQALEPLRLELRLA